MSKPIWVLCSELCAYLNLHCQPCVLRHVAWCCVTLWQSNRPIGPLWTIWMSVHVDSWCASPCIWLLMSDVCALVFDLRRVLRRSSDCQRLCVSVSGKSHLSSNSSNSSNSSRQLKRFEKIWKDFKKIWKDLKRFQKDFLKRFEKIWKEHKVSISVVNSSRQSVTWCHLMSTVCFAPKVSQRHLGASVPLPPTLALQQQQQQLQPTCYKIPTCHENTEQGGNSETIQWPAFHFKLQHASR